MDLFEEYKNTNRFTLYDAGFLLCNHPPLPLYSDQKPESDRKKLIRNDAWKKTLELIKAARKGHLRLVDRLDEAIKFNRDGLTDEESKIIKSGRGIFSDHKSNIWFVIRSDFKEWAIAMEINPVFLFPKNMPQKSNNTRRKHTTEYLEIMEEAIQEFWENHDPNRPPKKDQVVSWLEQKGLSTSLAESMDTIIRTPEARKGGQKPRTTKAK